jgi:hypothetical protein
MDIRNLRAEEIECRVQTVKEKGFSLLLYKDARCDMAILDEAVTPMGWKREHSRDNANCTVSIWDDITKQWIGKEDTGTESNTEKQKGLASDSFKRACFNWGIGRELYTAPFVWVNDTSYIKPTNRKDKWNNPVFTVYEKFHVYHIETVEGKIKQLGVKDSKGNIVYRYGNTGA